MQLVTFSEIAILCASGDQKNLYFVGRVLLVSENTRKQL
jgi:hypothetical protein